MYFARLLNKPKTCSSQVTILASSIYLLVIFFHLYSLHKLAAPAHFHPACAPLGTLFCSGVFLSGWERRDSAERGRLPQQGAGDRTCLSCALGQVQQLQAPCPWPVLSKDCERVIRATCLSGGVSLAISAIYLVVSWSQMESCSSEVTFCIN